MVTKAEHNKTEHCVGSTTYIVKSTVKPNTEKIILSKIRRLIDEEYKKNF